MLDLVFSAFQAVALADTDVQYNRDIRPILSDNCFACHGPDEKQRQAELRLDVAEQAFKAMAFVAGKLDESHAVERIHSVDTELVMPPPHSNKKLTAEQKELIDRWVRQGAKYQKHWAYEPPKKMDIPSSVNPIDYLIDRQLKDAGLTSSPEADRRTLIRRLSFDLVGLPASWDEVSAFEQSDAPEAFESIVEKLLSSPHYGERMAIAWLDVVRFADTIGYHSDNPRNIWPYRDYVINAFNSNKPFDQFTIEQIAGDLIPKANQESRVASAFNRLLLTTEEGGAQAKDYEARMMADRVRAIGTVWLGQTIGCAQCHDHKFDPIAMRDFYSMGAFFADIQEGIIGAREPGMIVATSNEQAKLAELDTNLAWAKQAYEVNFPKMDEAQKQWELEIAGLDFKLPELNSDSKANDAEKNKAKAIVEILQSSNRNEQQAQELREYYRGKICQMFVSERDQLTHSENQRNQFQNSLPKCIVSQSGSAARVVRILPRGNWLDESGEVVRPALPKYLVEAVPDEGRPLTRLDLAQWLVDRRNPLTARTVVNRLWKQFFGLGICKTLDDLGAQGEPPVNQELIDWLAVELIDSGWDIKHMIRLIASSKAYRRSSVAEPKQFSQDPYNRMLGRQSPFRLDAELVRDVALSTTGLLNDRIGGPSVKPYQPEGYWENLNFPARQYASDQDTNQYRRGLYTWWQRSYVHPSMIAFDAPTREECCAERGRSNIPQQALVMLNDPSYVESARALAHAILSEAGKSTPDRLQWAYRRVLQRDPTKSEVDTLSKLFEQQLESYRSNPAAAQQLQSVGNYRPSPPIDSVDHAAWVHVARVLLNLHETITRP